MNEHKARRHRAAESLKNAVIVLLICSAVILGWASRLFGNSEARAGSLLSLLSMSAPTAVNAPEAESSSVAGMPVAAAFTAADGSRYGIRYDLGKLGDFYKNTKSIFGQALGTAQKPVEVRSDDWKKALQTLGIYYEYTTPLGLNVLAELFGSEMTGDWAGVPVRRLCVTYSGGKNHLYFENETTGLFYASDIYTAETAGTDDISAQTSGMSPNGAVFAFETRAAGAPPYTLLMTDAAEHPALQAKNPLAEPALLKKLLLTLEISEQSGYSEADVRVFPGTRFTLRLLPNGTVSYRQTAGAEQASAGQTDLGTAIKTAYDMISETVGDKTYCGEDTAVYYSGETPLQGGGYQVVFRYVAAGGIVWLHPDGVAATITVKNGQVAEATLHFRSYEASDDMTLLWPEIQTAAAAGGEFMLGYDDTGDGTLTPRWVNQPASLS